MATKIQLRGDTLANWQASNPVLMDREVALVATDASKPNVYDSKKVGDGTHHFNDLPLLGYECLQGIGDSNTYPMSQKAITNIIGLDQYPMFSATTDYFVGDVVNYNGLLYQFTSDHAKGAWSGTDVKETDIMEQLIGDLSDYDFAVSDKRGKLIVAFSYGNIITKNFNSREISNGIVSLRAYYNILKSILSQETERINLLNDSYSELSKNTPTLEKNKELSDLTISDEKGNDIAEFIFGHFRTKNFDTRHTTSIEEKQGGNVDLDISDEKGNVIARFSNGHIRTKNFDSSNINTGGGGSGTSHFLPRPANGVVNFSVMVDTYIADNDSNTLNNQDIPYNERENYIKEDWGVINLPENYDPNGKPIRLVVACHGTGTWITSTSTSANSTSGNYLLAMGMAVMDVNGVPGSTPTSDRHYGTPVTIRSYLAAVNYCLENYNLKREIFVYGISMGGLASTILSEIGDVYVLAQGAFCPCIDLFREAYATAWNGATQRKTITEKFGFNKGTVPPSFTNTRPVPQAEKDYFLANIDKVIGYNSMWRNTVGLDFEECVNVDVPNSVTTETDEEKTLFATATKIRRVPIKIWHNKDDTTVPYKYSKYFVEMCRRGGCLAELRPFPSGSHNAWSNGEQIQVETLLKGTMTIYTSWYELYNWFKRFE